MTFENVAVRHIMFHRLAAGALLAALEDIWDHCGHDQTVLNDTGLQNYSGTFNCRAVRGSSRLSVHAFGAAIDFDAAHEPMNFTHTSHMADFVIADFKARGAFWGGDFKSRQDPMHFQLAHE